MTRRFDSYHFDGFDFIYMGKSSPEEIKQRPGWQCVRLENGEVWLKTPKTEWEKIKEGHDGNKNR